MLPAIFYVKMRKDKEIAYKIRTTTDQDCQSILENEINGIVPNNE